MRSCARIIQCQPSHSQICSASSGVTASRRSFQHLRSSRITSAHFASGGIAKAKATANRVLDAAYGYNLGVVLFKPTLTHGAQTFRTTKAGALAYFVGDDRSFPADKGFALGGWKKYEYRNAGIFINGDLAITMGNVILTDKDGKVTTVDKTWGFKKDSQGQLRIVLHHSSLPFQPSK